MKFCEYASGTHVKCKKTQEKKTFIDIEVKSSTWIRASHLKLFRTKLTPENKLERLPMTIIYSLVQ